MTGLRTASHSFLAAAALLPLILLLPAAAHADDVTIDYSQLDAKDTVDPVPLFAPQFISTDAANLKAPIHLHPLTATMTSPTVKNLVAEAVKPEIHLHPPAPKALAAISPSQPAVESTPSIPAPITNIDLTLAAVPVAPTVSKPTVAAATANPEPPKVAEEGANPEATEKTATADAPADAPPPNVDIALDKAAVPVKPKEDIVPPPAETTLADAAPAAPAPPEPKKSSDDMPPGFVRVNAVSDKTDDLTPKDVVGLDFGPPEKAPEKPIDN